ncbi:MAG: NUDIX domain-containing protein, partial [Maritimibacter sp.]
MPLPVAVGRDRAERMTMILKQKPIKLTGTDKYGVRTQFGALPWRLKAGKVQILLITSRGSGRWIIPKGWPMHGQTPSEAAATEAYEEAGIEGKLSPMVLGFYGYRKRRV